MKRVFLGTGLIGAAMAERALTQGDTVKAWNRSPGKALALKPLGAHIAQSAGDAVRGAGLIHLALTSDDAVESVLESILPDLTPGAILLDHSTTGPEGAAERFHRLRSAGFRYTHAPVMMSPEACRAGSGSIFLCGPKAELEDLRPALEPLTGELRYLGEAPHLAATYKLIGNAMGLSLVGLMNDTFKIASAQGLGPEDVLDFFQGYDAGRILQGRGRRMAAGDYSTQWTLKMARKDLGLMVQASGGEENLAILPGLGAHMDALIEQGEGEKDVGVIAQSVTPKP